MTQTTPTPGQPLSEADVSLLQPGDWLRGPDGRAHQFDEWGDGGFLTFLNNTQDGYLFSLCTYLGRPDQDGWIAWHGGENPVPGVMVECLFRDGARSGLIRAGDMFPDWWRHALTIAYGHDRDIIAYRPHAPVSRPGDGVEGEDIETSAWRWLSRLYPNDAPSDLAYDANEMVDAFAAGAGEASRMAKALWRIAEVQQYRAGYCQTDFAVEPALTAEEAQAVAREALSPIGPALTPPAEPVSRPAGEGEREAVAWPVVTDQWAETYCELTGRDPEGQQVTFVDGGTVTTFRDMARREIEAMLCAAPKSAVRTIATAEPAEARIRSLEVALAAAQNADAEATAYLRAKLARAVEGLERIAHGGTYFAAGDMRDEARQTLASLQQEGE